MNGCPIRSRFSLTRRMLGASLIATFIAFSVSAPLWAQPSTNRMRDSDLAVIREILEAPEAEIDLAKAKLTIDRMLDPSIDTTESLRQLDDMAKSLRTMFPAMASSPVKLEALKKYLYIPGPWNLNRPFAYDLDDPFGNDLRKKLLPTYIATRRGNCVSMPFLFVILGQKIGLDVTVATVPFHAFVKYRDEAGKSYNIEATSGGGFARDVWIRQQNPMTDLAVQSGIYMRPLSKKEAVVEMTGTLLEFYGINGLHQPRIQLALLVLQHAPKYVNGLLHIASAYQDLARASYMADYNNPNPIPLSQRLQYMQFQAEAAQWGAQAEALGWRPSSPEAEAEYLKRVQEAKQSQ